MARTPVVPLRPRRRGWHPDEIADSFLLVEETELLNEHQSLRAWLLGQLPLFIAGLVALIVGVILGGPVALLAVVVVLALIGLLASKAVQAWYTRYVITDLRVLRVSGVLNRNVEFIPWTKVTDVSRRESFFQWLVGSATIQIESANENSGFREMTDVHEPQRFYRTLVMLIAQYQGRIEMSDVPAPDDTGVWRWSDD